MDTIGAKREISEARAPNAAERGELETRRQGLAVSLRAADFEAVKRRVAKLFGMMPQVGADADTIVELVSDYSNVLKSQPLWAIDGACVSVIESGAKFRPSAPEFLALARSRAQPFFAEMAKIETVLRATVVREPDPAERARVKAKFDEFLRKSPNFVNASSPP